MDLSKLPTYLMDIQKVLQTLEKFNIEAHIHCTEIAVLTDDGYEQLKSLTHSTANQTFEVNLTSGRTFIISELQHLQQEIKQNRMIVNENLNFRTSEYAK